MLFVVAGLHLCQCFNLIFVLYYLLVKYATMEIILLFIFATLVAILIYVRNIRSYYKSIHQELLGISKYLIKELNQLEDAKGKLTRTGKGTTRAAR